MRSSSGYTGPWLTEPRCGLLAQRYVRPDRLDSGRQPMVPCPTPSLRSGIWVAAPHLTQKCIYCSRMQKFTYGSKVDGERRYRGDGSGYDKRAADFQEIVERTIACSRLPTMAAAVRR